MYTVGALVFGASSLILSLAAAQNVISFAPASQPTPGASKVIAPSFAGFGIEPSNLYSFTGGESNPNYLSFNLLGNLANYTGTPPHLRIGGNTGDNMIYDAGMNDWEVMLNPDPVGQGAYPTDEFIIGPRFFEVLKRFPNNTPITYGLNLAYMGSDYLSRIVVQANEAFTSLTNLNLVSFEIGNEPDLYLANGFRTGTWNGATYTQQWLTRAQAVWEKVLKPNGARANFFEAGTAASTIGNSFEIADLVQDGITAKPSDAQKPYILTWNEHDYYYYIGVSTYALTMDLFLDLSTTNDQFAYWSTQIEIAQNTGYGYALREMGVVGPIGMDGVTNVFAASLWTLNFLFYAATLNISSVQMHMTDNSNASAWQPIPYYGQDPHIRPNYYAFAAFAQTIGPTCQAKVGGYVIADAPAKYQNRIGAYSVYQDNTLASIVLINTFAANTSETKGSLTVNLSLGSQFGGMPLYLSYLSAPGADSKLGTTWNGLSYEKSGDGSPTVVDSSTQFVAINPDGTVTVSVRDSQALVANIGSKVGSLKPNKSACSALAAATPRIAPQSDVTTDASTSNAGSPAGGTSTGLLTVLAVSLLASFATLTMVNFSP